MTTTASARGKSNRRKGAETERAVARYLRTVGFPQAERAEKNGWSSTDHVSHDPGDLLGVPGIVWSVKNDQRNEVPKWLDEAERVRNHVGAELAVLVCKRERKASPSRWWCWLSLGSLMRGLTDHPFPTLTTPVSLELGELVPLLHTSGYGDAQTISEPDTDEGAA